MSDNPGRDIDLSTLSDSGREKVEELRKLSPASAYRLYEIIEGAQKSREEDRATMERLANDMRLDMQKTLTDTMQSVIVLVGSLRADIRDQNKRIGCLEDWRRDVDEDLRKIKTELEISA
jgi:hypothetical protein